LPALCGKSDAFSGLDGVKGSDPPPFGSGLETVS
jgi:hypothetical protein